MPLAILLTVLDNLLLGSVAWALYLSFYAFFLDVKSASLASLELPQPIFKDIPFVLNKILIILYVF